jgi:hypothetical protein
MDASINRSFGSISTQPKIAAAPARRFALGWTLDETTICRCFTVRDRAGHALPSGEIGMSMPPLDRAKANRKLGLDVRTKHTSNDVFRAGKDMGETHPHNIFREVKSER